MVTVARSYILLIIAAASLADDHIVTFTENADHVAMQHVISLVETAGGTIRHRYKTVLKGFAASIPESIFEDIEDHPAVAFVDLDGAVGVAAQQAAVDRSIRADVDMTPHVHDEL